MSNGWWECWMQLAAFSGTDNLLDFWVCPSLLPIIAHCEKHLINCSSSISFCLLQMSDDIWRSTINQGIFCFIPNACYGYNTFYPYVESTRSRCNDKNTDRSWWNEDYIGKKYRRRFSGIWFLYLCHQNLHFVQIGKCSSLIYGEIFLIIKIFRRKSWMVHL